MKRLVALAVLALTGCDSSAMYTTGGAVMLEESASYEPTGEVELLTEPPERHFREIAIVEARGTHNAIMPEMMERLRQEARQVGAHAVIPRYSQVERQNKGPMYNPFLAGYLNVDGATHTILRGKAIRFSDI